MAMDLLMDPSLGPGTEDVVTVHPEVKLLGSVILTDPAPGAIVGITGMHVFGYDFPMAWDCG